MCFGEHQRLPVLVVMWQEVVAKHDGVCAYTCVSAMKGGYGPLS